MIAVGARVRAYPAACRLSRVTTGVRVAGSALAVVLMLAMAMPTVTRAAARTWSGPALSVHDSLAQPLTVIACPSVSQCTAVDDIGTEVTFDPAAPGVPTPWAVLPAGDLVAVACPSI